MLQDSSVYELDVGRVQQHLSLKPMCGGEGAGGWGGADTSPVWPRQRGPVVGLCDDAAGLLYVLVFSLPRGSENNRLPSVSA